MQTFNKRKKEIFIFVVALAFLLFWIFLVYRIGAETLVESIGVHNAFLLIFLVALFGGLSSVTAPSFITVLATLAIGGLHPILLGLFGGAGLFLSDSFFFFLGTKGRYLFEGKWEDRRERLEKWLRRGPKWFYQGVVYLYTGFTPLPNDLLMVGCAVVKIPYRHIVLPLFLGNITLATLIALLAQQGVQLFA